MPYVLELGLCWNYFSWWGASSAVTCWFTSVKIEVSESSIWPPTETQPLIPRHLPGCSTWCITEGRWSDGWSPTRAFSWRFLNVLQVKAWTCHGGTLSVCDSLLWKHKGPHGGLLTIKVQARVGWPLRPGLHLRWLCVASVWVGVGLSMIEAFFLVHLTVLGRLVGCLRSPGWSRICHPQRRAKAAMVVPVPTNRKGGQTSRKRALRTT